VLDSEVENEEWTMVRHADTFSFLFSRETSELA